VVTPGKTGSNANPTVDPLSHPENPAVDSTSGSKTVRVPAGTGTKPPVVGRDSVTKPIGTIDDKVVMPDVDDAFDAAKRGPARKQAEAIYGRRQLSDSIRAIAARYVAMTYQEDQKFGDALAWANRAQDIRPSEAGTKLIDQLKQLMGN
jgi:hypothetical protein